MRLGLYARVSTQEQQTLALQRDAMMAYAQQRRWGIVLAIEEVGSGAQERRQREALMRAARRRDIDAIVVWRLDRWGRSLRTWWARSTSYRPGGGLYLPAAKRWISPRPRGGRWLGCWPSLPSLSVRFCASG